MTELPLAKRDIWLTSLWGFNPKSWGCLGFTKPWMRRKFVEQTSPGTIVCIYVTKNNGPAEMRDRLVGFYEVSHDQGHLKDFISGDEWELYSSNPQSKNKWAFALRATRAWEIIPEERPFLDDIFPGVRADKPVVIGSRGIPLSEDQKARIKTLNVREVKIYRGRHVANSGIRPLQSALKVSRAIPPAEEPYFVGEIDSPKHLYILRLEGNIAAWLGRSENECTAKEIIKVGFSKSPLSRRDQIQSAYPAGTFRWSVLYPANPSANAPCPNAKAAIVGEDAMKAHLVSRNAEILGGEFFLADDEQIQETWMAGLAAIPR